MMFSLNYVRKNVVFSLIGVSLFSGMSMVLSSGVEAQDMDLLQWHPLGQKGQDESQGALVRMGKDLVSMADILAVDAVEVPPDVLAPAFTPVEPKPANTSGPTPLGKRPTVEQSANAKTIAIDSGVGTGEESSILRMDSLQFAAQMWSNASFPVERFQAYTSPFGYRSSPTGGYREEFHYGLDIAAPQSSYIRNWWAGTVIEVSDGGSCGTSVVIQSGEWTHMYCHMQGHVAVDRGVPSLIDRDGGIQLWEGQQIIAGDRIGRVGMTGRTTGPHLHWGLKYQGDWVDPAWVLQAMAASYQALYGQN